MAGKMTISRRGINRAERIKYLKEIRSDKKSKTFKACMKV